MFAFLIKLVWKGIYAAEVISRHFFDKNISRIRVKTLGKYGNDVFIFLRVYGRCSFGFSLAD